jgi:cytochrome c
MIKFKKILLLSLLTTGLSQFPQVVLAQEGETLIREAMCYACHQMESVSLGPPWQAIAARHDTRKELMTEVLAGKIVRGGGGNWGNVPMVPNQRVSAEQARIMAEWVLEQTP